MDHRLRNFKPCPNCGEKPKIEHLYNGKLYKARCLSERCNMRVVAFTGSGLMSCWNKLVEDTMKKEVSNENMRDSEN